MKASLLAPESTGGDTARDGFGYQDAYVLQNLPLFLFQPAFSHVVSEATGDVEICYFGGGGLTVRTFIEAKGGAALSWGDFWKEIEQFKKVFDTSPAEFPRFVLVCRDFNSRTSPLVEMVGRVRGVGRSYDATSPMLTGSHEEIIAWGIEKGLSEEMMTFILGHVAFETYADESAQSAFQGELTKHLPSLDLRSSDIAAFRLMCLELVSRSSRQPVHRAEIEAALSKVLGRDASLWAQTPTPLHLDGRVPPFALGLDATAFNGPGRDCLSAEDWWRAQERLEEIGTFVRQSRQRAAVALSAKQRMSLACTLGFVFSATRGFILDVEHNGGRMRTDDHSQGVEQFFSVQTVQGAGAGAEGVATISFPTGMANDVTAGIAANLASGHALHLVSARAVDGIATMNKAVAETKAALVSFRSRHRLEVIHLFIKGPSHFAMMLGHRLNGVCRLQLYDWVAGRYVPTALLGD
ncbi:dsDNA nuclease domain-containing protein [Hydrogenophaga sp.]|uniref:CD-NTase-associated endodeoxyribonuclease Cap4 n=1 Tax=Hydrogenophaga sp. TaxID=1904254 RepID=UPI00272327FC|nr:dsDNA nuclease domain-containing protein [Hydrogenophaga sp.]MDO8905946.1 SAVED domain-containing protein [Hydrogenophaga sp.]